MIGPRVCLEALVEGMPDLFAGLDSLFQLDMLGEQLRNRALFRLKFAQGPDDNETKNHQRIELNYCTL